jgi:hypothetical protein
MTLAHSSNSITLEQNADSPSLAETQRQREQFARNAAWFQAHAAEIAAQNRGKCICVAGEELHVADTAHEALALATAAHPEDRGRFVHYIPKQQVSRIYAN